MADSKIKLTKADRFKAFLRSYFLLASFNYERMQNGGVAYTLIPAIKNFIKLKKTVLLRLSVTWNSLIHNLSWPTQSLGLLLPWKKNVPTVLRLMMLLSQGLRSV